MQRNGPKYNNFTAHEFNYNFPSTRVFCVNLINWNNCNYIVAVLSNDPSTLTKYDLIPPLFVAVAKRFIRVNILLSNC